jgi:hypothetical protein
MQNKPVSGITSSPNETLWQDNGRFECSVEWHFSDRSLYFPFMVYSWASRLSVNSGKFFCSVATVSTRFAVSPTTSKRAFQVLESMRFFVRIHFEHGRPVVYKVISHADWAQEHPGLCTVRDTMPWDGEGDLLGRDLYVASGGFARFFPCHMPALRKLGLSDPEILAQFNLFLRQSVPKGREWKDVFYLFRSFLKRHIRTQAQAVSGVVAAGRISVNSRNEVGHP